MAESSHDGRPVAYDGDATPRPTMEGIPPPPVEATATRRPAVAAARLRTLWAAGGDRVVRGALGSALMWGVLDVHRFVQAEAAQRARWIEAPAPSWFQPWAIFLYLGMFPVLVLTFAAATTRAWWRFVVGCGIACAVGWLLMLAVPVTFPRPVPGDDGVAALMVQMIQHYDPAHVTFPSLHVATTWLAVDAHVGRRRRVAIGVAAAAISVSTILVGQHGPIDVAGGFVLGLAAAWLARRLA